MTNNSTNSSYGKALSDEGSIPSLHLSIIISLTVIAVVSCTENVAVIFTILWHRSLRRSVTNLFVVSLCSTQFMVSGLMLPSYCFLANYSIYGFLVGISIFAYVTNLCAITYERLVAVEKPLLYQSLVTRPKALKIIGICWVFSIVQGAIPSLWNANKSYVLHKIYMSVSLVFFLLLPFAFIVWAYLKIYMEVRSLLKRDVARYPYLYKIPCQTDNASEIKSELNMNEEDLRNVTTPMKEVSIVSENNSLDSSSQYQKLRGESQSLKNSEENGTHSPIDIDSRKVSVRGSNASYRKRKKTAEARVAWVFAIVAGTYFFTWLPVVYMTTVEIFERDDLEPIILNRISIYFIALNSMVDPLIYGLLLKDIRAGLKKIIKC